MSLRLLFCVSCGTAMVYCPNQLTAQEYTFAIVATPGDQIDGVRIAGFSREDNSISINDSREVAFLAYLGEEIHPDNLGIMTRHSHVAGAGKLVDGLVPYFDEEDHAFRINSRGQVVYRGLLDNATSESQFAGGGIFLSERLIVEVGDIVGNKVITGLDFRPSVNDRGDIAFVASYAGGSNSAVFTQDGVVHLKDNGIAEAGETIGEVSILTVYNPEINNDGEIAFSAALARPSTGPQVPFHTGIITQDGIVIESGQLSPAGAIVAAHTILDGKTLVGNIGVGDVSDAGEIAFGALWDPFTGIEQGWFTQNGLLVSLGSIIDGREILRFSGGEFSKSGNLAFLARTDSGEAAFYKDRYVIGVGDQVDGNTIVEIASWLTVNRRGDLAFLARFDNDTSAIVLAAVPEPANCSLLLLSILLVFGWSRDVPWITGW